MKTLATLVLLSLVSTSALANTFIAKCSPEMPGPAIEVEFKYNINSLKTSIVVKAANGKKTSLCKNGMLKNINFFLTEKKASSKINCDNGSAVVTKDFDEQILDLSGLKLNLLGLNFGNNRFMCN